MDLAAVDPVLRIALGLALGGVLLDAARHKLRAPQHYAAVIDGYRLLPRGGGALAVRPLAWLELLAGAALVLPFAQRGGALAAAALLSLYFVAMALNLARGRREIDCGCGAPDSAQTLAGGLLVRNALLIAAAGWLALGVSVMRPLTWLDWVVGPAAAALLLLLYATVNLLLANRQRLRKNGARPHFRDALTREAEMGTGA